MTHEQVMARHKIYSDVKELTAEEKEVYEAFLELAETERDVDILSRTWLKLHRRRVLGLV